VWHTAALPLLKKFPKLKDFLSKAARKPKTKGARTGWKAQLAIAQRWHLATGGKLDQETATKSQK
jgi:hypothetical protein